MTMMQITHETLSLDCANIELEIIRFIQKFVDDAKVLGVMVGLSGGIDSSVVGALCVKALGRDKVIGLLMPARHTPKEDLDDATDLVKNWGVRSYRVDIDQIFCTLLDSIPAKAEHKIAHGNAKARIRMTILYYLANLFKFAVAGTGDRSEDMIGYFTKYGDGGVDFLPIAHLYKTQVRMLASHLGLPQELVQKPSSPQLWPAQKATDEIPIDYDRLDLVLHGLFDVGLTPEQVSVRTGVPRGIVDETVKRHAESQHKRTYPPMVRPW